MNKEDPKRGTISKVKLKKTIHLNGKKITHASIEIDHINYGLDKKTKALNKKKRLNFSLNDIQRFLYLLDGEQLFAERNHDTRSVFIVRILCPIQGKFFDKEFVLIFETDHVEEEVIFTITLFPNW